MIGNKSGGTVDSDLLGVWETLQREEPARDDSVGIESTILPAGAVARATGAEPDAALPRLEVGEDRELQPSGVLGRGGMGMVQLARQRSLGREVAIKSVPAGARGEESARELVAEARTTGMLEHPNVVPIHALGRGDSGAPLLVMKRVEGVSWREALDDAATLPEHFRGQQPLEAHLQILIQVCQAVHFAHSRGVIHRDLKPANVMLGAYGEVYVVDWGLAMSIRDRPRDADRAVHPADVVGTPAYMAPEMAAARLSTIDERTDVYLLGAILHELITGRPRHRGETLVATLIAAHASEPISYPDEIPRELEAIVNRATAREPRDRYDSADALRRALVDYFKYRDSRRLTEEARQRLTRLAARLGDADPRAATGPPDAAAETRAAMYELFAECRFGFEQARRLWPDNENAERGRCEALELMTEFELERGDDAAAGLLIAQHPSPPARLVARLDELGAERAREKEEYRRLKEMRREIDVRVGAIQRARACVGLGLIFAAAKIAHGLIYQRGTGDPWLSYLALLALLAIGLGLGAWSLRRYLFANQVTTRIIVAVFLSLAALVLLWVASWRFAVPIVPTVALENVTLAGMLAVGAVFMDRRLHIAGLGFVANAIAVLALASAWGIYACAAGNLWVFWSIAVIWSRDVARQPPS